MAIRNYTLISLLSITGIQPVSAQLSVPEGYQQVARQAQIPAELLYAVAMTESGSRLEHDIRPWPWTLNVAGKSYRYATQQQACTALQQFMQSQSHKRIDAGLGQINIGWNGHFFSTPCDALQPYQNLRVTAQLLRQHYQQQQSWLNAAGRYHHPAGGVPAQRYRQKVAFHLQQLSS